MSAKTITVILLSALAAGAGFRGLERAGVGSNQSPRNQTATNPGTATVKSTFSGERAWDHLRQMVAIGPRPAGSLAIRQTRAYITRQVSALGLAVQEQPFTAQTPMGPVGMVNLIVRLPGRSLDRVLVTGHYDTKYFADRVFVGASDGASSAALLIELVRAMQPLQREFTYEFVWFDGEEAFVEWMGYDHTYGSRYYVQAAQQSNALSSIRAMLLVDMIGDRDLRIRRDLASTAWLTDIVWAAAKRVGHGDVFVDASTQIEDDHMHFMNAGVPSVDIIDLDYPAWHTPADDLTQVSQASLQTVGDVVLAAIPDLEQALQGERSGITGQR